MKKVLCFLLLAMFSLVSCDKSSGDLVDLRHEKVVVFKAKSSKGLVQLPDGAVYKGEYKNGLFDGEGQLVWSNGNRYVGEFRQGLKHGKGRDMLASGTVYDGDFVNGFWEGQGTLETGTGGTYVGEFKQGMLSGKGKYVSFDGKVYDGDFKNNRMNGKGSIIYPDGGRFRGEVKDWRMNGEGEYTTPKKYVIYKGHFVNDEMKGKGEIRYKDGSYYKGEIHDWQANGTGKAVSKRGMTYTGEFKNNLYNGIGVLVYKNGDRYEGGFEEGLRQGHGKLIRANPKGHKKLLVGWWQYGSYYGEVEPKKDKNGNLIASGTHKRAKLDAESIFYSQRNLLDTSLADIKAGRPDRVEMYFLGFAGYGGQDVFMKEVRFAKHLFDAKYLVKGHSVTLINNPKLAKSQPLASVTNLGIALKRIAARMNPEQDILFMYLTSHGSRKNGLSVSLPGLPLNDLSADKFAEILRQSKIKWKVIAISSCYSGEFVKALKDEHTLVMTSARADHVSFGCSEESDFTYFGEALLKDSIPSTNSFVSAFKKARELVMLREDKEKYDHSDPQLWTAPAIEQKLLAWRHGLKQTAMLGK